MIQCVYVYVKYTPFRILHNFVHVLFIQMLPNSISSCFIKYISQINHVAGRNIITFDDIMHGGGQSDGKKCIMMMMEIIKSALRLISF